MSMPLPEGRLRPIRQALVTPVEGQRLLVEARAMHKQACDLGRLLGIDVSTIPFSAAVLALHLPLRRQSSVASGELLVVNLHRRGFKSAELLLQETPDVLSDDELDWTLRLLLELEFPRTSSAQTQLLADVVNLADFGLVAIMRQWNQQASAGKSLLDLARGLRLRESYGYWQTRLRDLCFEPTRQLAEARLKTVSAFIDQLDTELEGSAGVQPDEESMP